MNEHWTDWLIECDYEQDRTGLSAVVLAASEDSDWSIAWKWATVTMRTACDHWRTGTSVRAGNNGWRSRYNCGSGRLPSRFSGFLQSASPRHRWRSEIRSRRNRI